MTDVETGAADAAPRMRLGSRFSGPIDLAVGLHVEMTDSGDLWDAAAAFQYEQFLREGFCAPSPHRRVEEYDEWSDRSIFHVVHDGRDIHGVIRTITDQYDCLPVAKVAQRPADFPPDDCCEFASFTISKESRRGTGVPESLFRSALMRAVEDEATSVVAVVVPTLFFLLRRFYGFPFLELGPAKFYMGSDSLPIGLTLLGCAETLARESRVNYQWFFGGLTTEETVKYGFPIVLD